jgi:hypothetical protein
MSFTNINIKELALLAPIVKEHNQGNLEETLKDLEFIDNCFSLMKTDSLRMRRSPRLRDSIHALVHYRTFNEIVPRHGSKYLFHLTKADKKQ